MTGDSEPLTEPTPEGAQIEVPGIRPVTLRDRLALRAAQPMAPRRKPNIPQKPCNVGLFDIDARRQTDLLDLLRAAASGAFKAYTKGGGGRLSDNTARIKTVVS